jgi:hypothetical protein
MMTAAEARRKARELRKEAARQTSSTMKHEMIQIAEQFDLLAAELERLEDEG